MGETYIYDQEQQIKRLKRRLEGWRVALLPIKSVLLWEQQWHPALLFGIATFLYLLVWLIDPNFLTTVASVAILINFVDFLVPIITKNFFTPSSWTGHEEKIFEDMCRNIVVNYNTTITHFKNFYTLRDRSPKMYFILSIGMLSFLAWLGSTIDNIFLLYLFFVAVLLWPGLQHRGITQKLLGSLFSIICSSGKEKNIKAE